MTRQQGSHSHTTFLGLMLALALALHTIERCIPPFPVPGVKIGFANIISLIVLLGCGLKDAILITILRLIGGSFLGGTFMTAGFLIGLSGGITSLLAMQVTNLLALRLPKPPVSIVGISCVGAVFHNLGQIWAVATIFHDTAILRLMPFLLLLGLPSGILTGIVAKRLTILLAESQLFPNLTPNRLRTKSSMGDWLIGATVLVTGVGLLLLPILHAEVPKWAVVRFDGSEHRNLDLDRDELIDLDLPYGKMVLEIKNHRIRVAESSCEHQTCIASGWIALPGQSIACIPNRVAIVIPDEKPDEGVDAVTY